MWGGSPCDSKVKVASSHCILFNNSLSAKSKVDVSPQRGQSAVYLLVIFSANSNHLLGNSDETQITG